MSDNTASELTNIKEIIENLVTNFQECTQCIEKVVKSNDISITETEGVVEAFHTLDQQIGFMGGCVETIGSASEDTMTEIGEGAKKNADASEEVTASIQELNSMMQTVDQNSGDLNSKIEELVHELTKFTV